MTRDHWRSHHNGYPLVNEVEVPVGYFSSLLHRYERRRLCFSCDKEKETARVSDSHAVEASTKLPDSLARFFYPYQPRICDTDAWGLFNSPEDRLPRQNFRPLGIDVFTLDQN